MELKLPKMNKRNFMTAGLMAGASSILFAGTLKAGAPDKIAKLNQKVPNFDIAKSGGGKFNNASLLGKTTIVEFWGLWCPDCLVDGDNTNQAAILAKKNGIEFMAIHTRGRYGRWGSIEAYFKEKGYSYPTAIDDDGAAYKAFELGWVPTYLVIDKYGTIRDFSTDLGNILGVHGLINKAKAVKKKYK